MKEVWVCSQGVIEKQPKGHCRWYKNGMCALKGHTELTMQGTVGPFPCDAKKFVEEKVGKWRRMGSYACATDIIKGIILEDGSVAEGEGVITGFQCTVCGEKWYTPGFCFDGKEKTPAYCHCGARMECDKIQE